MKKSPLDAVLLDDIAAANITAANIAIDGSD